MLKILGMLLFGLIAGYAARFLLPGRQKLSVLQTMLLGVVGSFVGGFIGYQLFDHDLIEGALQPSGILGSIVGSLIALFVYRRVIERR